MKKVVLLIVFLILVLVISAIIHFGKNTSTTYLNLSGKTYKLLKATNQNQWEKGLMFYKSKKELGADGMIFIFPNKQFQSFWNENTYLDLDVYWLKDDKVIGKSHLPPITKTKDVVTINSPGAVDKVVEIIL